VTKHNIMKVYMKDKGKVTFALDIDTRREQSLSRPGYFTSRDKSFLTHWIGAWFEPRTGRNPREKFVLQKTETDRPIF
jgi:hypothetical protein